MVPTQLTYPPPLHLASRHVAIIGAGAAGLVAARELHREGHNVVVYERDNKIGGTWVYDPRVERDLLGSDPGRNLIHSSMYSSLRTNLPRETMGFKDFPFVPGMYNSVDPRRFPGHREVLVYLEEFARVFELEKMVRFESEVVKVKLVEGSKKWKVKSRRKRALVLMMRFMMPLLFAMVIILSLVLLRYKVVVLIGSSSSSVDISREISTIAKEVHVASRSVVDDTYEEQPEYDNMWLHSMVRALTQPETGWILEEIRRKMFEPYAGTMASTEMLVSVNNADRMRQGRWFHCIQKWESCPCRYHSTLHWVVPFPQFEFQGKWIAGILSGRIALPSQEEMMEDVKAFYAELEASNTPTRYTHLMGDFQFNYNNWLAAQCGCLGTEEWRKQMYNTCSKNKRIRPETYRDEWEDDSLISEAHEDFTKYTSASRLCKSFNSQLLDK